MKLHQGTPKSHRHQDIALNREISEPLYLQLENVIKENISSGKWTKGCQLPTYRQLAKMSNVSMITVQQAVDHLVNQNVLYRRQGQGTFVVTHEMRIASKRIGFFLPNLREPFFSTLAQIIQTEAINDGYTVSLFSFDDGVSPIARAMEIMLEQNVDGIITTPANNPESFRHVLRCRERGIPMIMVDGHLPDEKICFVECDNRQGMALILDHLIGLGHSRIGFASGPLYTYGLKTRMEAFQEIMTERGIELNPSYLQISHLDQDEGGWDAAHKLLQLRQPPTAIACTTDLLAAGVLRASKSLKIAVPGALSIVGFDDLYLAAHLEVPMTTVKQPVEQIGRSVMRILMKNMTTPDEAKIESCILPPTLVLRASTGPAMTLEATE